VFAVTAFALVLAGPLIGRLLGIGGPFEAIWSVVQWPLALALVVLAVAVINYFAPDAEQDWTWITPGAILATALWLIGSLGFKIYVAQFADYNETYGSLGGVVVLMLWFYVSSLAILVGAEMNAEIEHASPHGKDAGEKVPGQKKRLGAAAARAFAQRGQPTLASGRSAVMRPVRPLAAGPARRLPGLITLIAAWLLRRRNTVR
jgi:membrane protein